MLKVYRMRIPFVENKGLSATGQFGSLLARMGLPFICGERLMSLVVGTSPLLIGDSGNLGRSKSISSV